MKVKITATTEDGVILDRIEIETDSPILGITEKETSDTINTLAVGTGK